MKRFFSTVITFIVDTVFSAIEKRVGPEKKPPPVQPYPRSEANGHWDPEKTDPDYPSRRK